MVRWLLNKIIQWEIERDEHKNNPELMKECQIRIDTYRVVLVRYRQNRKLHRLSTKKDPQNDTLF